jgi:phosphoribosylglycinamide formyltransferase-1
MNNKINLGILISGRGSNLQAIIEAVERGDIAAKVAVVISNNADAYGLERAKKHNIPAIVVDAKAFENKDKYEEEIVSLLEKHKVDLVCLAGYMKIVGPVLLGKYKGKMLNIHPALLPAFPGLHVQKKALDYGVKVAGCTVHFVDEGCDTGPIIVQKVVPVEEGDTEDSLSARILEEEHKAYPEAIDLLAKGELSIEGRVVRIKY